MKPLSVHKNMEGFITLEEAEVGKRKADAVLKRLKAAETQKGKTTFTGTVNGKYTQLTIRGEQAEGRFLALCNEKLWDFSNFTMS